MNLYQLRESKGDTGLGRDHRATRATVIVSLRQRPGVYESAFLDLVHRAKD